MIRSAVLPLAVLVWSALLWGAALDQLAREPVTHTGTQPVAPARKGW